MPHVSGDKILDKAGNPFQLRGAQIETPFNYISEWEAGVPVSNFANPAVFKEMVQNWNMNVLRLPISNWIYAKYPDTYMKDLDTVVNEATAAGLHVVLDLHDDAQSGSPYGNNLNMPKQVSIDFWKIIASHYKDNPKVMFDLLNEPKVPDWNNWLNGGGTFDGVQIVGFQAGQLHENFIFS